MVWAKNLFWTDEETVVQFHPRQSVYVNQHPFTLHLWKPMLDEWVLPPRWMIGTYPGWEQEAEKDVEAWEALTASS